MYEEFSSCENSYITKEECYKITQNLDLDSEFKKIIVNIATECIRDGMFLGTKMVSIHNASAWINHSYYVVNA